MLVRWTTSAADDFTHICDYTGDRFGPAKARSVAMTIFDSIDSLASLPLKGPAGRKPGTRELSLPGLPFVVIYRVRDGVVEIARILHGAQKWP
jgi:toxin ParE1/3/4